MTESTKKHLFGRQKLGYRRYAVDLDPPVMYGPCPVVVAQGDREGKIVHQCSLPLFIGDEGPQPGHRGQRQGLRDKFQGWPPPNCQIAEAVRHDE